MSTYQILDIALNGTFFATVAAIAVLFVIVREGASKRESQNARSYSIGRFDASLEEAAATLPSAADLLPRSARAATKVDPDGDRIRVRPDRDLPVKLTRSERELMESIGRVAQR